MTLVAENVEVSYDGTQALRGVSLRIEAGEVVALVGANGAGKSTLLNVLMGLVDPKAGAIRLGDRSLDRTPTRARIAAGLALAPEGRHVFPELTVDENLRLGDIRGDPSSRQARIEEVRLLFPVLAERRGQAGGTLSGGEQQMLAIGRALMARPKFLLLDEPTLGLAPIVVAEIARFVRGIRGSGMGVLLAEQNAAVALSIADRAYVLENGRVAIEGPAAEVAGNPDIRRAYLGI